MKEEGVEAGVEAEVETANEVEVGAETDMTNKLMTTNKIVDTMTDDEAEVEVEILKKGVNELVLHFFLS